MPLLCRRGRFCMIYITSEAYSIIQLARRNLHISYTVHIHTFMLQRRIGLFQFYSDMYTPTDRGPNPETSCSEKYSHPRCVVDNASTSIIPAIRLSLVDQKCSCKSNTSLSQLCSPAHSWYLSHLTLPSPKQNSSTPSCFTPCPPHTLPAAQTLPSLPSI